MIKIDRPEFILLGLALWLAACGPAATPPDTALTQATSPPPTVVSPTSLPPTPTATPPQATPTTLPSPPTVTVTTQTDQVKHTPAPNSHWTAIINQTTGSLTLQPAGGGEAEIIFPEGSTAGAVTWSPDSRTLLVVRNNWQPLQPIGTGGRYSFRYPAGWTIGEGWRSLSGWHRMPTLSSAPNGEVPDELGPFSGHLWLAVEVKAGVDSLETALAKVLPQAGLNQVLGSSRQLIPFDQRQTTVSGLPALRLETLGDFGLVNHVLIVQAADQALILRGHGDGRVFEAIANSLVLMIGSN